jgi:stress response protein YsnF
MNIMDRIRKAAVKREQAAKRKATKQLRAAKSAAARERAMLELKREQLQIKKEVADAKTANLRAETELKEARRKAGYLTPDERIAKATATIGRGIASGVKAYRSVSGTSTTKRKSGGKSSKPSLKKFIYG